jgi:sigma-B regulation protein RsbU (phosphoserine phosphatase)
MARDRIVIGRHPGCDVVLESTAVSRQHAELTRKDDDIWIEDLRSRNGTSVNGRPLTGRRQLEDGDEILIGDQLLAFASRSRSMIATNAPRADDVFESDGRDNLIVSQVDVARPATEEGLTRQAEARLRAVLGLQRAVGASLSLDDVLPRLLDGLLEIFPRAERGFVLLVDPQSRRMVLKARKVRGTQEAGPLRLSLSLIEQVARSHKAILSADAVSDSRFNTHDSVTDCRIRSVMCVPVVGEDDALLGVVQVDSRDVQNGFVASDLELLAGVAGQAARLVEQAIAHDERIAREQLDRDLELAHRVQQGLLPSCPPAVEGYEVFDFYEPARHVGGDFFTYVPLPDGRLAVVLADVSGKGVAAALLMAALSADIRYCLASEPDLATAVGRINESFLRGGWDDRFATLVVVVLDPRRHRATICNAGHLPVFVRDATGGVRTVAADLGGLPLGMAGGREYRSCDVDLALGDTLLLCTDGITEALDHESRLYGLERLQRVLAKPADGPKAVGRRLLADVERHAAGQVRSDDICIVCVGRIGSRPAAAESAQKPGAARRTGRMQSGS